MIAAVAAAALLVGWQALQLPRAYAFDYVEGMMLHGATVAGSGETLYPRLGALPILITAYTPLYYYLCAAGNTVFGPGFFFGRLVSLIAMISIAVAIGLMVRRRSGRVLPAAAAASFFYLTLPARNWAVLMRVDALEIALAIWGFYAAAFANRPRVAAGLFLLSFLTKHTMFAAPAAVLVAWWLAGRRRDAAVLAATLAASAALFFASLGWTTGGASWVYLFGIHGDPWIWTKWTRELLFLARTIPLLLALAAWLLIELLCRGRATAADPIAIYLVFAFLSTLLGAKDASFWNHYLEFCAVAAMAAGAAVGRLAERPAPGGLVGTALVLQLALMLPMMASWRPGLWHHVSQLGLLAAITAAGTWIALPPDMPHRRWIAGASALICISIPGLWYWQLVMLDLGPALLSAAALVLLLRNHAAAAGVAAVAATVLSQSLLAIAVPVAWSLLRSRRRWAGLLFIVLVLAAAGLSSPEANLFHSPRTLPLPAYMLQDRIAATALLLLLAFAAAVGRTLPLPVTLYVAASAVLMLVSEDAAVWIAAAPALAIAAACSLRVLLPHVAPLLVPAALIAQLALLTPFDLWIRHPYDAQQLAYVYEMTARQPDPIIVEQVGLLAAAGKPVLVSDPRALNLSRRYWNEDLLLDLIERRQVRMVELSRDPTSPGFPAGDTDPVWSRRFIEALLRNYVKTREYDAGGERFYFFEPRRARPEL